MKAQLFTVFVLMMALALLPSLSLTASDDNDLSSESPGCTDRPGPAPTLTPIWHESGGGRIEIRRGERVWTRTLGAPVSANTTDEGIHLQVLNQHGEPVASARVEAYAPESESREWSGYADEDGRAEVSVPDGTWTLVVSSANDHFVVVREGVSAPGSLTLDTTGTVSVEVTASRLDGQPLSGARISFEPFAMGVNMVGDMDLEGHLHVDVTPGTYCGLATSWSERYYLNQRRVMVTGPTSVSFDATQMGTGQVVMRLSGFAEMELDMLPQPRCRGWRPIFTMADGETTVLSADRYELNLGRFISGTNDTTWYFSYDANDTPYDILPGSVTTVWAGGTHVASITPRQATYPPGARVYLDHQVVDAYGNHLTWVAWDWEPVYAHVIIRGPQGSIVHDEDDCWWPSWAVCTFVLVHDAAQGWYEVEWTLDTGPLQGVLHATTDFSVEGSPVTPTPTGTATPTPTCTPTPTSTPAWKLYLPLIRKETP